MKPKRKRTLKEILVESILPPVILTLMLLIIVASISSTIVIFTVMADDTLLPQDSPFSRVANWIETKVFVEIEEITEGTIFEDLTNLVLGQFRDHNLVIIGTNDLSGNSIKPYFPGYNTYPYIGSGDNYYGSNNSNGSSGESDQQTTSCDHSKTIILQEKIATCGQTGLTEGKKCANCSKILVEQTTTAQTNAHKFGEWNIVEAGGCSEQSYSFRICQVCKKTEYSLGFTDTTHPHEFEIELVPATCVQPGYVKVTCQNCKTVGSEETIKATGHNLKWGITSSTHEAYCRNEGCTYKISKKTHTPNTTSVCLDQYCTVCDTLIKNGIGHNMENNYSYNSEFHWKGCQNENCDYISNKHTHINYSATCLDISALCELCNFEFIPEANHVFGAWYTTKEPSCSENGTETRKCTLCDHQQTRDIDALGHTCDAWAIISNATCIESGQKSGFCTRCEKQITETIPALGHQCNRWNIVKEATCTDDGEKHGQCSRCNQYLTETIRAAHSWSSTYYSDAACHWRKCTKCGALSETETHEGDGNCMEKAKCSTCKVLFGNVISHDFSHELSHDNENHFNICKRGCGSKINVELHNFTSDIETVSSTDTGEQILYTLRLYLVCEDCEYKYLYDEQTAKEHYGCTLIPGINPTCTKSGLTWGWACSVDGCGEVYKEQEIIPALGHNYVNFICTRCDKIFYSEGLEFTSNGNGTCYVSGIGSCTDTQISIPLTYEGMTVVAIGSRAFYKNDKITNILIPDGVASIGDYAFADCKNLENVIIPESITHIGNYAFDSCAKLKNTTIPDGIVSIGYRAFSDLSATNCSEFENAYYLGSKNNPYKVLLRAKHSEITSCTIHTNTEILHSNAFAGCALLADITIPEGITHIPDQTFAACVELKKVVLPSSITSIGEYVFFGCKNLETINLPQSITSIGDNTFGDCSNLNYNEYDNAYYLGSENNLYFILIKAKDTSITACKINDATKFIQCDAFSYCSELTSISIPEGVVSIGGGAFGYCTKLESIDIANSVSSIGSCAFYNCHNLESIEIPYGITEISGSMFQFCSKLEEVVLPNSIKVINGNAFAYCNSIKCITIPTSVTEISDYAFAYSTKIETVFYSGSEEDWKKINIGESKAQSYFLNAEIKFNYDPQE